MTTEHIFPDSDNLYQALTALCLTRIQASLLQHGQISLLLSGGTTPLPFYRVLAGTDLPWQHIFPALVDERWVPLTDEASNETSIRMAFAGNDRARGNFTGMYMPGLSAVAAAPQCSRRYAALPVPALCLLGMGNDGHTASLFPKARGLQKALEATDWCAAIDAIPSPVTGPNTTRMTLTPWGILQAELLVLLIRGDKKWQVYEAAKQDPDYQRSPVSHILHQDRHALEVFWCP